MVDTISFTTMAAIIAIGLIIWYFNQKQAAALVRMARATEDTHMIAVKNRRDALKQQPFEMSVFDWVAKKLDNEAKPLEIISKSQKPMWVNLRCQNGSRVVISPLSPTELKPVLNAQRAKSKLSQAEEPLLGTFRKGLTTKEVSLRDDEWFDMEADTIGKKAGVDWGEVTRLFFYSVTPKASK